MPKRRALDNDEFRGMNFSYDNVKNMVVTLLKQKFKLEHGGNYCLLIMS